MSGVEEDGRNERSRQEQKRTAGMKGDGKRWKG